MAIKATVYKANLQKIAVRNPPAKDYSMKKPQLACDQSGVDRQDTTDFHMSGHSPFLEDSNAVSRWMTAPAD